MIERTSEKRRSLTVDQLGIVIATTAAGKAEDIHEEADKWLDALDPNDEILKEILLARDDGYAGVILSGPPGTSKSWYADKAAQSISEFDRDRVRHIQFHPSYQYEDFVEGYVADGDKFVRKAKTFALLCQDASEKPSEQFVLVIDEISRTDVARVFGEALTFIEVSKRDQSFLLASGNELAVPKNLFIIATMNPWDRGVDELDLALLRRFAHIDMPPKKEVLAKILLDKSVDQRLIDEVGKFFDAIQRSTNPYCRIGHAYFVSVKDKPSLERLWRFQLKPYFERATKNDTAEFKRLEGAWTQMLSSLSLAASGDAPSPQ